MWIEVPDGEVVDRITILELKQARLQGSAAVHAGEQAAALRRDFEAVHGPIVRIEGLVPLRRVNAALWAVEDQLRDHEARGAFGEDFVDLARSVYRLNDQRAALKRAIDDALGSALREHKSYGTLNR